MVLGAVVISILFLLTWKPAASFTDTFPPANADGFDGSISRDPAVMRALFPNENETMQSLCRKPPSSIHLPRSTPGPPRFSRRINTLFNVEDFLDERIMHWADALGVPSSRYVVWRKIWEWGIGLYALDMLGKLRKDMVAVGLASGHEHPIYYLSHRLKHVFATDIYGEGSFALDGTASTDVFNDFGKFSPLKSWIPSAVSVLRMDARNLSYFADASADIVFSFSSIEHFPAWGSSSNPHSGASQSMKEQSRILKTNGAAIVATEIIINGRDECHWPDFFTAAEFMEFIVKPANQNGLDLIEDIDWSLSQQTIQTTLNIDEQNCLYFYPHALLRGRQGTCVFGSVMAVFVKS